LTKRSKKANNLSLFSNPSSGLIVPNPNIPLNSQGLEMNRRAFLKVAGGTGLSLIPTLLLTKPANGAIFKPDALKLAASKLKANYPQEELFLSFYNRHTGESLKKCVFWAQGGYNPEGLKDIQQLFRDHRTNTAHEIDRDLLHLLHQIHHALETSEPFHLISGYRSPKSNAMLNSRSCGVAKNSLHVYGKAADIDVPGRSLKQLQAAAKILRAGGVGRYTQFVHVDTGRVRYWGL
jgi:uncharacterized protein YcbK (DUF882 family)